MTNGTKINKLSQKPRVLVAPLEWGLGHATRCIPIINELILNGCEVLIAAEGATKTLLRSEFPGLTFLPLTGYRVKYARKTFLLLWKLFSQFPKIMLAIEKENQWLNRVVKDENIDAVISDNRFGLHHHKIRCIYITHQLLIKTGNRFTEKMLRWFHYLFIKKYSECWVPDFAQNGLAGELSHPSHLLKNVQYIGPLSRFKKGPTHQKKYDLLITISGPEPQRTIFEEKVLTELEKYEGPVLVVRGLPEINVDFQSKNKCIEIVNHLSADELNSAMVQSDLIICRSGYTSIMDLIKLQKKAILIPTPGQTEQEYLSKYVMEQKYFYCIEQKNFSLKTNLEEVKTFSFLQPDVDMNHYKIVIKEFVESLNSGKFASSINSV